MEYVVLVDEQDCEIGIMEKMQAHVEGGLHRAVSVFLFNTKGEFLLQRRAQTKYHSAGLWTNACCSHPRPGESALAAASRRLQEEMGISCLLKDVHSFMYKTTFDNDLTEYEFDHVFTGVTDAIPAPDPEEVWEWKYIPKSDLLSQISEAPDTFTIWFRICLSKFDSFG